MGVHDGFALPGAWPTPNAHDGRRPGADMKSTQGGNLSRDAALWLTPNVPNGGRHISPELVASKGKTDSGEKRAAQWPKPASRDYRTPNSKSLEERGNGTKGEQLQNYVEHHFSPQGLLTTDGETSCKPPHGSPRQLNPAFTCWLMGWPMWWTNPALTSCARAAMESYRSRLQWHLSSLCGEPQGVEA
jgi:hypothetical protein